MTILVKFGHELWQFTESHEASIERPGWAVSACVFPAAEQNDSEYKLATLITTDSEDIVSPLIYSLLARFERLNVFDCWLGDTILVAET